MAKTPTYIDLDATAPSIEVVVKLKGTEHRMVALTVDEFVANVKASEIKGGDVESQMMTIKQILIRSFPTMTIADLGTLTFAQLNQLRDGVAAANGQLDTETEIAEEVQKANPPIAG